MCRSEQERWHRTATSIELRFEDGSDSGSRRVRPEIGDLSNQQEVLEQQFEVFLGFRRNRHHDGVAAPIFCQQPAIGQLLLDALRLRSRFVDLVGASWQP